MSWLRKTWTEMMTLDYWKPKGDTLLWISVVMLAFSSLVFIYSSTGKLAYRQMGGVTSFYLWKQILFLIVGYFVIVFFQNKSCKRLMDLAPLFMVACIMLMCVAWIIGQTKNGAGRWIPLPFGLSFQPSELTKLITVAYVARDISLNQDESGYHFSWHRWILPFIAIALIFKDNVSTALLLSATCFFLVCVGRLPWKQIGMFVAGAAIVLGVGLGTLLVIPQHTMHSMATSIPFLNRVSTVQSRVLGFFDSTSLEDMTMQEIVDDQSIQSKIAIASGGLMGKGPGNSSQCNVLPEPYSDFIFAIVLEESGIWGMFGILLCYILMFITAFRIMFKCSSLFMGLFVVGIVLCLLLQAIIHMCVCVGLFPVTGQTLPLVSKGGTATLIVAMEIGLVLGVSNAPAREAAAEAAERAAVAAEVAEQQERLRRKQQLMSESSDINENINNEDILG